ncbi:MAG: 2-dehydropantoate 2-reductase [Alphaproteobacteria bacterium]|nr:2-dehydropantoate 2-reductase [Alphaproteobacteria bacterium]
MKICIVGAGATGGYLGVKLINAGFDVSLVARGAHLTAMKKKGLTLIENDKEITCSPKCSDSMKELGKMDFIFITLKAYSINGLVKEISTMFDENTSVISAYNGIPWWYFFGAEGQFKNYRIKCIDPENIQWNVITPERIIGCVVYPATEIIEPGVIKHIEGNRFSLGEPNGAQTERISSISKAMARADLKAPVRKNIRQEIWMKLIGNLAFNPLSVITEETLDVLLLNEENKKTAYEAMKEATSIMDKLNVPMSISIDQRIEGAAKVGSHKTSMLQDYERGKELELDALVVAVKEIADLLGIKTPTIDRILHTVTEKISKNN